MIDFDNDPKWTAYALGELDAAERAECDQILETNPDARAYVASLKEAIGTIETELAAQPAPALDELQRKRIEKAAQVQPKRSKTRWLFGAGAAAAGVAVLVLATSQMPREDQAASNAEREGTLALTDKQRVRGNVVATGSAISTSDTTIALEEGQMGQAGELDPSDLALHIPQVTTKSAHDRIATITPGRTQLATTGDYKNDNQPGPPGGRWGFKTGEDAPNTEAYARIDDNQFHTTAKEPLSTFSIDVDTASYANLRRYLESGARPPKDAVRIEEMLNYFKYDYAAPTGTDPFSIATEVGPAPWNPKHQVMRVSLATAMIDNAQVPARNLVFLIDTSGSMQMANKLPLVKQSLTMLVESLREQDQISVVAYAGAAGLVLPPTSGHNKGAILDALNRLEAGGSTNGGEGIQLAYATAQRTMKKGGINRVILCSDGDMNVGITSEGDLTRLIEKEREKGVFLTVLGYGMGNLKDATMEKLADRGNGNYAYIDSAFEARKVLVKQAGATLVTVAKDVKLQLEFNPTMVAGHRLIGYENRVLAHADFTNDKKDAGEIGAGHAVTALYEIVPVGQPVPTDGKVDNLKYQTPTAPTAGGSSELLTVKIRYKEPNGSQSKLLSRVVDGESVRKDLQATSTDFRWAAAIAGFGMLLRGSPYRGNLTWQQVSGLAASARGQDVDGYRIQAIKLIDRASKLPPSAR